MTRILRTINTHDRWCEHPECNLLAWYAVHAGGRVFYVCSRHHRYTPSPPEPRDSDRRLRDMLLEAGMDDLAALAASGEYHDLFSPHAQPKTLLCRLLQQRAAVSTMVPQMLRRIVAGEFDHTPGEGEEWAASDEGIELLRRLTSCGCSPTRGGPTHAV